jgi:hypothetical protein
MTHFSFLDNEAREDWHRAHFYNSTGLNFGCYSARDFDIWLSVFGVSPFWTMDNV